MASNKNQMALFLTSEINKSYNAYIKKIAEKMGLKNAYRPLLFELAGEEGCTQLALVRKTGLKAPTVSITLRKMELDGLITRQTDEHDLRKTRVYLSETGREIIAAVREKITEMEADIFHGLDLGDKEIMVDALQKVRNNLILLHQHDDTSDERIL